MHIAALALGEFIELTRIAERGNADELARWIEQNSYRPRRREQDVLYLVTAAAAARMMDDAGSTFYRLELGDDTTSPQVLAGRLTAAALNKDDDTTRALIATWCTWKPDARAAVLADLVRAAS